MMRVVAGPRTFWLALLFFASFASSQDSVPPIEGTDEEDHTVLHETLYVSIDPADVRRSADVQALVERQAEAMVSATQRRVLRQEKRIAEFTAAVHAGKVSVADMQPLMDEMRERLETARVAIERANALRILIDSARAENKSLALRGRDRSIEKFQGTGYFTPVDMRVISRAFHKRFGRSIPVSASGDTDLHRALGFDHRGRVDVALSPDHPEGAWLCKYLQAMGIPYYAFRRAVPGSATAPHIHIGPGSVRRKT